MKVHLPIFVLMMVLAGCNHRGDAEVQKNLSGMWTVAGDDSNGSYSTSTITVDPNGGYVCQVVSQRRWDDGVAMTSNLAGKFEVRDGKLIDTMTKHSNTNAVLPWITRGRIVRSVGQELVVSWEASNHGDVPTNETVFRKNGK